MLIVKMSVNTLSLHPLLISNSHSWISSLDIFVYVFEILHVFGSKIKIIWLWKVALVSPSMHAINQWSPTSVSHPFLLYHFIRYFQCLNLSCCFFFNILHRGRGMFWRADWSYPRTKLSLSPIITCPLQLLLLCSLKSLTLCMFHTLVIETWNKQRKHNGEQTRIYESKYICITSFQIYYFYYEISHWKFLIWYRRYFD